uniref:Uncharacterized protein n=1 Tax=Arundo donax TaxID=35708 RepID=A0A0A9GNT4_ARUDO
MSVELCWLSRLVDHPRHRTTNNKG